MPRVVVVGGSGHVGTYLVPRLVEAGHEVINVARGERTPYQPHAAWKSVRVVIARRDVEDHAGTFAQRIRSLKPDIVIDMICFTLPSAEQLVGALRGEIQHFLHAGTIWVHGPSAIVPTTEAQPRNPIGEYGTRKAAIEAFLLGEAGRRGFPATVVHPGHIVGPGWSPLNPAGHFDDAVFETIARGAELAIPNFGQETVHHVHADDVAQLFMRAIARPGASVGEAFHAVSPAAVSLRGYAEAMYAWFGREPKVKCVPWPEWKEKHSQEAATATWEHIYRSPSCSIAKAVGTIGYGPRYSSLQAVQESVSWLVEHGQIGID
jgi:nucleoside-diphosphate-sugar epimerase